MANAFDPYREALVVETKTIWPDEFEGLDASQRETLELRLHADPQAAADMDYERMHTGFCRQITVTSADLDRVR